MSKSRDEGKVCICSKTHQPMPVQLHEHHIWPEGMGGPDTADNRVWLCPTTHANAHELLRWFIRLKGAFTWKDATTIYNVPVSRYAFSIARLGWLRMNHGG